MPTGAALTFADGTIEAQAAWLADRQVQRVQMATWVGLVQGNRHVRRVLARSSDRRLAVIQRNPDFTTDISAPGQMIFWMLGAPFECQLPITNLARAPVGVNMRSRWGAGVASCKLRVELTQTALGGAGGHVNARDRAEMRPGRRDGSRNSEVRRVQPPVGLPRSDRGLEDLSTALGNQAALSFLRCACRVGRSPDSETGWGQRCGKHRRSLSAPRLLHGDRTRAARIGSAGRRDPPGRLESLPG